MGHSCSSSIKAAPDERSTVNSMASGQARHAWAGRAGMHRGKQMQMCQDKDAMLLALAEARDDRPGEECPSVIQHAACVEHHAARDRLLACLPSLCHQRSLSHLHLAMTPSKHEAGQALANAAAENLASIVWMRCVDSSTCWLKARTSAREMEGGRRRREENHRASATVV